MSIETIKYIIVIVLFTNSRFSEFINTHSYDMFQSFIDNRGTSRKKKENFTGIKQLMIS